LPLSGLFFWARFLALDISGDFADIVPSVNHRRPAFFYMEHIF
jgi:hypothetical protein